MPDTVLQPLATDTLDRFLASRAEWVLREVLGALPAAQLAGTCLRVDELPPAVINLVAGRLVADAPGGFEIGVLSDAEQLPTDAPGYVIDMGRAVELRNDLSRALLIFVPPDLRAGAIDSLSNSTFAVVAPLLRDNFFANLEAELVAATDRLNFAVRPATIVGSLRELVADRDDILRYYLTILDKANYDKPGVVGGSLYCLGLFPDFDLTADPAQYDARLKQNSDAVALVQSRSGGTLFARVQHLRVREPATHAALYKLLTAEQWRTALTLIATDPAYRDLALERWLPDRQSDKPPILYIEPLKGMTLRPDGVKSLNMVSGKKNKFTVGWTSDPPPAESPAVVYYRVELLNSEGVPAWTSRNVSKKATPRHSRAVELNADELDDDLYYVRVRAFDSNGNVVNDESSDKARRDPGNERNLTPFNTSEPFYLGREAGAAEDSVPLNRGVGSLREAMLLANEGGKEAGKPEFEVKAGGSTIEVRFEGAGRQQFTLNPNPLLAELEHALLEVPEQATGWAIRLNPATVVPPATAVALPADLLAARRAVCDAVQQAAANGSGGGLIAATDLLPLADKIEAYLQASRKALIAVGHGQAGGLPAVIGLDVVAVQAEDGTVIAQMITPLHPLLLGWQLRHARLQADWLRQARGSRASRSEMGRLLRDLLPRNLPPLRPLAGEWLLQTDVLGGWPLYLPLAATARRAALAQLAGLGAGGDYTVAQVKELLARYQRQHPYVRTLRLNVFGAGAMDWLADAMVELQKDALKAQADGLAGSPELSYDIQLFSNDPTGQRTAGSALTALLNPERQVSEAAGVFTEPGRDPLHPRLRVARHQCSDFLHNPAAYPAHISLLLDPFPVTARLAAPLAEGRSSYINGLVQQPAVAYDNPAGGYRWRRQLRPGPEQDPFTHTLAILDSLHAEQVAGGACDSLPTLQLHLEAESKNLLYQLHDISDWVLTFDQNIGLEYFDGVDDRRQIYLLAFDPPFLGNADGHLLLTTRVAGEVVNVLRRVMERLGLPVSESRATELLVVLRSLSGGLALRLLDSERNAEELVGLLLTRLYFEQNGLLRTSLLIPIDAHQSLLTSRDDDAPNLRGDLLLVQLDPGNHRLTFHVVEVKYRKQLSGSVARDDLADHIAEQVVATRKALENRFDSDKQRVDHQLRSRELISLLEFYLERASRYGLVDPAYAETVRPFLYSLDDGYEVDFKQSGLIFSPQVVAADSNTDGVTMLWLGQESINRALAALPGHEPALSPVAAAVVEYFTTGRLPRLATLAVPATSQPAVEPPTLLVGDPESASEAPSNISSQVSSGLDEMTANYISVQPSPAMLDVEQNELGAVHAGVAGNDTVTRAATQLLARFAMQPPTDSGVAEAELAEIARAFSRAARSYRINVQDCDPLLAKVGPSVIRFYVRLVKGQSLNPLRNALEDIGREMRRERLLVTTQPNSDLIALDVPRSDRQSVPFALALSYLPAISGLEQLPITIGVTPEGEHIVRDLATMPHMLVGGTTGAGKTIFLYSLLGSLLYRHPRASDLRLFISTSKSEDFTFFRGLPQLEGGQVVSDAQEAVDQIEELVEQTFEQRRVLLEDAGARDVAAYNARSQTPLAPFVVVVDEFADLADQLAGQKKRRDAFYNIIRRIAQLGRNRSVHLVLCTQRPSVDLVPSNIRTLMNSRVALRMNDAIASKMILDEPGAEQLQKHGDLLFKEDNRLMRLQGYYFASDDLARFLAWFRGQPAS